MNIPLSKHERASVSVGQQHDGLTMLHLTTYPVGAMVYDLTATDCRALASALLAEATRQDGDRRAALVSVHAALTADGLAAA